MESSGLHIHILNHTLPFNPTSQETIIQTISNQSEAAADYYISTKASGKSAKTSSIYHFFVATGIIILQKRLQSLGE